MIITYPDTKFNLSIELINLSRLNLIILSDRLKLMIKPPFIDKEIYHIYNRGVEKRIIFNDDRDRFRFIHSLFQFNDTNPTPTNNCYYYSRSPEYNEYNEVEPHYTREPRKPIVDILAFCLMPNHFHLMLRQKQKNGIVNFMKKLGTGYTMYFNKKHERVGPLFQGRFKAVHVGSDEYFRYLCHYIHLNPLDMNTPEWREGKIKNFNSAIDYIENYRWSSLQDYSNIKNFPSVISKNLISEVFNNRYKQDLQAWIKDFNLEPVRDLLLE